jgi:hypothetical protein
MADITITFTNELNSSLQIGDIIYQQLKGKTSVVGACKSIATDRKSFVVDIDDKEIRPTTDSYIFFGKDNQINTSGILGYHANVKLANTSTDRAELYAVNSEVHLSSN